MLKRIAWVLLLSMLMLGALFAVKYRQMQQAETQIKPPMPALIAVAVVRQEEWPTQLVAVGSFNAVAGVEVSSEVVGKIKAIYFDSGQAVSQGQLLLELDSDTDRAELNGLQAELQLAESRLQRSEKMVKKNYLSQAEYDQHIAQLQQARAAVAAKQTRIEKKQIRAPFAGDLGIRQVDLGQFLQEGQAIVKLQQLQPIYLDFSLPERHISQLHLNQIIQFTTQAYSDRQFQGAIVAINPALDNDTRSVKVRAKIDNKSRLLRPGMFAQIQIVSGSPVSLLTLPDTAISYNPYGNAVFLVEENSTGLIVNSRQVVTGKTQNGRVEIISGLKAGDRVVSAGQIKLRNGMAVTVDSQPAPGEREPQR